MSRLPSIDETIGEQQREESEVNDWKERVLLHCPEVMDGPRDGGGVNEPM
jgi:hypothetical protein